MKHLEDSDIFMHYLPICHTIAEIGVVLSAISKKYHLALTSTTKRKMESLNQFIRENRQIIRQTLPHLLQVSLGIDPPPEYEKIISRPYPVYAPSGFFSTNLVQIPKWKTDPKLWIDSIQVFPTKNFRRPVMPQFDVPKLVVQKPGTVAPMPKRAISSIQIKPLHETQNLTVDGTLQYFPSIADKVDINFLGAINNSFRECFRTSSVPL